MPEINQIERAVRILRQLSLRGETTVSALYAFFQKQVPKRTLQRDLIALSAANIPLLTKKGRGKEAIWFVDRSYLRFIPETIGSQELLASYFLERLALITKGTQLEKNIQSLLKKTRQLVTPDVFASVDGSDLSGGLFGATYTGYIDYTPHSETIESVLTAAMNRNRCSFTYRRHGSTEKSRFEAEPYMILFHKGALYVVARVVAHDSYILLAIQRIVDVTSTGKRFTRNKSFSLESLRKDRFGIFGHPSLKPQKVVLKFSPDIADTICERVWHPTQKLTKHKDGSVTLTMRVPVSDELLGWIASWRGYVTTANPIPVQQTKQHDGN